MTDLLPCPFCGGEACEALGMSGDKPWKYAECIQCGSLAELNYWNRRAPLAVDDAMVERAWNICTLGFPENGFVGVDKLTLRAALEAAMNKDTK